ncbi:MAG TPA: hypothetical protein VIL48_05030 [Acidimicrobiales bacterium]
MNFDTTTRLAAMRQDELRRTARHVSLARRRPDRRTRRSGTEGAR